MDSVDEKSISETISNMAKGLEAAVAANGDLAAVMANPEKMAELLGNPPDGDDADSGDEGEGADGAEVVTQAQKRAEPHGVRQAGAVREVRQDGRQKKSTIACQQGAHPGRRHCHRRVQEPEARHGPGVDGQAQRLELDDSA
ncbi:hypothetical protein PMKS-003518 [Pichia membranifaciens]|uniref:Uncharacterized protein n=1 Tax=Pichia membranifaciens TaxID=4926 RepID=A0A1Q2YKD8_9ASCO|nr:hypothetical protein PMKS-003518 [Pichia membranifaciens]